ncbi:MAG: response regulator transcription factor [Acidobacteria bacterium]|nr:response regulator transcription factor [Acidobacteriota bacterium]
MSRILIVEDEAHLARGLEFNLAAEGHSTVTAADAETALDLLLRQSQEFDLVVLDVMLPSKDGFAVAAELREACNFVPILMLTARGRPEDVLRGFAAGADDYLAKPFELSILLARLGGLLRRREWARQSLTSEPQSAARDRSGEQFGLYSFQGRTIDFGNQELRAGETTIHLTVMESELLRHLVHNRGRVVSRKSILEEVWGLREDTDTRAIDNFIVRLRRYLEDNPARPKHLRTVRGVGYRFDNDDD